MCASFGGCRTAKSPQYSAAAGNAAGFIKAAARERVIVIQVCGTVWLTQRSGVRACIATGDGAIRAAATLGHWDGDASITTIVRSGWASNHNKHSQIPASLDMGNPLVFDLPLLRPVA